MMKYRPMKYRPAKKNTYRRRRVNPKRLGTFIAVVVAIVVLIVVGVNKFGKSEEGNELPVASGPDIFEQGVSISGVNIGGMNMEQARAAIAPAEEQLVSQSIEVSVPVWGHATSVGSDDAAQPAEEGGGDEADASADVAETADDDTEGAANDAAEEDVARTATQEEDIDSFEMVPFSIALQDVGAIADTQAVLDEALAFRRTEEEMEAETMAPKDYELALSVDPAALTASLEQMAEENDWGLEPQASKYRVKTINSEEDKTTYGEMVETEDKKGVRVKTDEMAATIQQQIESGQLAPFDAPTEEVSVELQAEETGELQRLATATTGFADSLLEKKYNIWKMSEYMNGVTIYPGESFSMNDTAGPRTEENGWWEALGIEDGNFTPQYGGGICQVSSTMYNAVLKAEMEVINRVPHSIMSDYVKPGLDATISTGGPDFIFENPYDTPVYMIVNCDVPQNIVTVELWGTEEREYEGRPYYVELYSEMISDPDEKVPTASEIKVDSSIGKYDVNELTRGRRYQQYQVYKRYLDKETDEILKDGIEVTTSTYNAISPIYQVGTGVPYTSDMSISQLREAAKKAAGDAGAESNQTSSDPNGGNGNTGTGEQPSTPEEPSTPDPQPTQRPDPQPTEKPTEKPKPTDPPDIPDIDEEVAS